MATESVWVWLERTHAEMSYQQRVDATALVKEAEERAAHPWHPTPDTSPRCPTCGSHEFYRITGGRKLARFATIGVFAVPKALKSFECRNCKGRW